MAETDKPTGPKPIVDVAHPGKSAPSGNSKSVIVSNRPLLKDPMVVADNPAKMPDKELTNNQSAKIKGSDIAKPQLATAPLLESEMPDETAGSAEPVPPSGTAAEPATVSAAPIAASQDNENEQPDIDKTAEAQPPADKPEAPNDDVNVDKSETADADGEEQVLPKDSVQQLEAEAAAKAKQQAAVAKLADSKQYYLPINTVEKRRSRRFVAIGVILSLLLIVAWADIALDAGLIHIHGLKPITHFFSS